MARTWRIPGIRQKRSKRPSRNLSTQDWFSSPFSRYHDVPHRTLASVSGMPRLHTKPFSHIVPIKTKQCHRLIAFFFLRGCNVSVALMPFIGFNLRMRSFAAAHACLKWHRTWSGLGRTPEGPVVQLEENMHHFCLVDLILIKLVYVNWYESLRMEPLFYMLCNMLCVYIYIENVIIFGHVSCQFPGNARWARTCPHHSKQRN